MSLGAPVIELIYASFLYSVMSIRRVFFFFRLTALFLSIATYP